jgi:hypothetical protein
MASAILNLHELNRNKLFLNRTRKDSNFKRPPIYATLFQIENCCYGITPLDLLTPDSKLRAFVERAADVRTGTSELPLFDGKSLASQKESAHSIGKVPCPAQLADVSGAYAISISDMANAPALLPGIILYVHPKRPVVINDLVVNRVSWSPLVFYLRQSDDGDLYGLTLSKKRVDLQADDIERLHKVAGIWMISTNGD